MAERWFLKIDGIAGESADVGHKGEIEVLSWSWGVTNPAGPAGGSGGGSGLPGFSDFVFSTQLSKASPRLFLAAVTGSHHRSAVLTGVRGAVGGSEFVRYTLSDVMVTSDRHGDSEASVPTEEFALGYAKIEVAYTPTGRSGQPEAVVKAGFDLKRGAKA
jgi:type VI secretion system secreted protein Hcp